MDSVVTGVTGAALVTAFATSAAQGSSGTVTGLLAALQAATLVTVAIAAGIGVAA